MRSTIRLLVIGALVIPACGGDKASKPAAHGEHEGADRDEGAGADETQIVQLAPEAATRVDIRTTPAESRALAAEIETTGQVGFDETRIAHVSPRIAGRIHSVRAQLGDRVEKGAVLAVLDSVELGEAKGQYLQAKARLEVAKSTFEREQGLAERQISSKKDMQDAQAAYREARAAFQASEQTLRLYGLSSRELARIAYDKSGAALISLRAPLAGKVVEKHAAIGELVTPDVKIYTVADLTRLWIWIDVYERDLARVHPGDRAYVRADSFPDQLFEGTVTYIEDRVDEHTRTTRARIDVANPNEALRSGMFARVRLEDPHAANNGATALAEAATVIPHDAVQRDGEERVVFVRTAEHRYERREVTLGRRSDQLIEVLEGVKPGEHVVTHGAFILKSEAAKASMGGGHSH